MTGEKAFFLIHRIAQKILHNSRDEVVEEASPVAIQQLQEHVGRLLAAPRLVGVGVGVGVALALPTDLVGV